MKIASSNTASKNVIDFTSLTIMSVLVIGCLLTLTGCSNLSFPGVFKIDVAQGNIITKEMVEKLKPGMTKRQVRYVMGSPLLTDTFHQDRWDYYYTILIGDQRLVKRHISLYFENGQFKHYEGDVDALLGEPQKTAMKSAHKRAKKTNAPYPDHNATQKPSDQPDSNEADEEEDIYDSTNQETTHFDI